MGYFSGMKVLVFKKNTKANHGPAAAMFFTERPPRQDRPRAAEAARGAATALALDERADRWLSRERQEQRAQELADRFDQRPPDEVPF